MVLYPEQLDSTAICGCFAHVFCDVKLISEANLQSLGPMNLVIARWPCQGHSRAGAIHSYRKCFNFNPQDLEGYKGKSIHIQLEDNHLIFWRPYRPSVCQRIDVHAHCRELLGARLIELFNGEYAYATVMPSKNDIFRNWQDIIEACETSSSCF